ncbi:MAG: hypothetical protein ABL973_21150 [Micropepsaceae bacterium]
MNKNGELQHIFYWTLLAVAMLPFFAIITQVTLKKIFGIEIAIFDVRLFFVTALCAIIMTGVRFGGNQ